MSLREEIARRLWDVMGVSVQPWEIGRVVPAIYNAHMKAADEVIRFAASAMGFFERLFGWPSRAA